MSKSTDLDMKEVELNELDQEKQPMTGDGPAAEKNGTVKIKVPDDEVKFTGLSKEELMKVAGTAGWVRTRWLLLVLFWLGWVGMLAGAVVIIVQAPRCKPMPTMNWWNEGPLYQISDLDAFNNDKGLMGVSEKLDVLSKLKVKGVVLGPLHTLQTDILETLDLAAIEPTQGSSQDLQTLLEAAHKKGISVVLDLTPNYGGADPWFHPDDLPGLLDKLQAAADHWLRLGLDGIQLSHLRADMATPPWARLQAVVRGNGTAAEETGGKRRALMGVVGALPAGEVSEVLNATAVDLLLSDTLNLPGGSGVVQAQAVQTLYGAHPQQSLAWGLGGAGGVRLASAADPALARLHTLLLFTLPGTPVFTYGDEIGLQDSNSSSVVMPWDSDEQSAESAEVKDRQACRAWFRTLSDLRGKERSLLHGDYLPLHTSPTSLAFLRLWDQSERYLTALNWGAAPATLSLLAPPQPNPEGAGAVPPLLPAQARVRMTSAPEALAPDSLVSLETLTLAPGQAALLTFPFAG